MGVLKKLVDRLAGKTDSDPDDPPPKKGPPPTAAMISSIYDEVVSKHKSGGSEARHMSTTIDVKTSNHD